MTLDPQTPQTTPPGEGWEQIEDIGFLDLVGPIWRRRAGEVYHYGFRAEPRHRLPPVPPLDMGVT